MSEQHAQLETLVNGYLSSFDSRELSHCMDLFADDAVLVFLTGTYKGKETIEQWHQDRFSADLRLTRLNRLTVEEENNKVELSVTATSKRLRAWGINDVNGTISLTFQSGMIVNAKIGTGK